MRSSRWPSDRLAAGHGGASLGHHLKRWGAAYVLLALFLGSWVGQFFTQMWEIADDAAAHGRPFEWIEFWPAFGQATFENWQSEWLQLLVQAVMLLGMKHVLFKVDAEDMERLEAKVDVILLNQGLAPEQVSPAGGGEPSRAVADEPEITGTHEEA